jgi:hypothetical protein
MVDPDRRPLSGVVEMDETNVPYRKKTDPVTGGQGRSPIGKMVLVGAVERWLGLSEQFRAFR